MRVCEFLLREGVGEVVAGELEGGLEGDGALVGGDGVGPEVELGAGGAEVVPGFGGVGIDLEGAAGGGGGLGVVR